MSTVKQIWQRVHKRSPVARQKMANALAAFLRPLDNPHAQFLTGGFHKNPCDQTSAQSLEAWVVGEFAKGKITRLVAAEWLRLLLDLIYEFKKEGFDLFPTRLADAMRPVKSPFSPAALESCERVEIWRDVLHQWILSSSALADAGDWKSAIAVSAVLHGALIDTNKLEQLMDKLNCGVAPAVENGVSNYAFLMPYEGLGNHHLQRWFPDRLTEMLIWRMLRMPAPDNKFTIRESLQSFFVKSGLALAQRPKNPADFVKTAVTWWSQRASALDIQCATRLVTSHAIHARTWARIHGTVYDPLLVKKNARATNDKISPDEFHFDDLLLLNPWLAESLEILKSNDVNSIANKLDQLLAREPKKSTSHVFLSWLAALLQGFSASKEALALSTIRLRYAAVAPRLLAILGETNPAHLSTPALEDCYSELTIDTDPMTPSRDLGNGLRDFHAFLHRDFKKPLMRNEAEVLGDENSLKPVDGNFITFDEYLRAQVLLDSKRIPKHERHIAKLVLMMAFRLGMRRMEIFGLQLRDFQVTHGLICLVRKNAQRRLKTTSSQRLIPLEPFLAEQEQRLLLDWVEQRQHELPPPTSAFDTTINFIFKKFEQSKREAWVRHITDLVCSVVRETTGDHALFLHHLRHAFGTWTYLRLRAPDFPELSRHFKGSDATIASLDMGTNLRSILLGRQVDISRKYAYSVSRLMGHSSPVVSLGHYIHVADIILGEIANREVDKLPKNILMAASGLKKSAAFENIGQSPQQLLIASRSSFKITNDLDSISKSKNTNFGRPRKTPLHLQSSWISFETIEDIISLSINDKENIEAIAATTGIEKSLVEIILDKARNLANLMNLKINHQGELIKWPKLFRIRRFSEFASDLESKIASMHRSAPLLLSEGLTIHFQYLNNDVNDVVFKGKKHLHHLNRYLKFLESLGYAKNQFTCVLRVSDLSNLVLPKWTDKIKSKMMPSQIKTLKPKNLQEERFYSEWLGIMPVDTNGVSLAVAMKKTLFLAKLSPILFPDSDTGSG